MATIKPKTSVIRWALLRERAALMRLDSLYLSRRAETRRFAGRVIRKWRGGLSLRTAATGLGISAPYLSDVERGKRNPERVFTRILGLRGGLRV